MIETLKCGEDRVERRQAAAFPLLLLSLMLLFGGCTAPTSYLDSIKKFETSAVSTSTVARTYLLELNKFERSTYLETLRADPNAQFDGVKFLDQPFAPEAIQARIDALDIVIRYAGLLGQLAGSPAGEEARLAAKQLGTQIGESATLLAGAGEAAQLQAYVTPLGDLAGAIAKIVIEEKQVAALNDAIEGAAEPVREITGLLRNDLKNAVDRRILTFSKRRAETILQYKEKKYASEADRLKLLQTIQSNEDTWEQMLASGSQVAGLVDSLRDAHESLVAYAKSSRGSGDLASLTAAIELFAARADSVIAPLEKLAKL